ncbi:MAG: prepilin-type N-terminal cleavage/methylation domain-containing protein [Desulfobacterales bacterium]|nr:prepilin-type N-terminal cleavage/methylation domain-containing protein [Desulfobacterales bacterium]
MNRKGFTLIELLIAMVVASIVLGSIYAAYRSQTQAHRTQQLVVQMQQNMRAALYLLEREIMMAGYSITDPPAPAGFVQNFASLGSPHDGSGAASDANNIAFTMDSDDSGTIDAAAAIAGFEIIAYRLNAANSTLERWDGSSGAWQVAAEQITSLAFTYHREDDSQIPFPLTAADLPDIRSIEVALTATSRDRNMNLTHKIKCRNMGY